MPEAGARARARQEAVDAAATTHTWREVRRRYDPASDSSSRHVERRLVREGLARLVGGRGSGVTSEAGWRIGFGGEKRS